MPVSILGAMRSLGNSKERWILPPWGVQPKKQNIQPPTVMYNELKSVLNHHVQKSWKFSREENLKFLDVKSDFIESSVLIPCLVIFFIFNILNFKFPGLAWGNHSAHFTSQQVARCSLSWAAHPMEGQIQLSQQFHNDCTTLMSSGLG